MVDFEIVRLEKGEDTQLILGHAGFIKTAEDLYEAMLNAVPGIKFGVAFAEASGKLLVRMEGNSEELERLAAENLLKIRAGHTFIILFTGAFPINVIKHVREVNEVARIYCATANPVSAVVARDKSGSAIIGVIDGQDVLSLETEDDRKERRDFLRKIGYKK